MDDKEKRSLNSQHAAHSVGEAHRDALFQNKMLEQAVKRGDARTIAKVKFDFKHGDLVQMTSLGISRQKPSYRPKTHTTVGTFIRMRAYLWKEPKHPVAIVRWVHDDGERESETRIDYLEPLGTPR